jgi:hypothetical protein
MAGVTCIQPSWAAQVQLSMGTARQLAKLEQPVLAVNTFP